MFRDFRNLQNKEDSDKESSPKQSNPNPFDYTQPTRNFGFSR